ncbi:hypothetical protein H0H81_002243 [Sphagnurus paluster]|uniref:GST N-terminal domain-containing protein n=1 Tax=Sphagnurus paluster TaxID=117069 RepID=A0A9P7K2P9_9AGAR|nr:hypothetical protein H0H81_002243 [Sphagnurus paluster]
MSSQGQELLVLYDIPSAKGGETWSPNVWRTRAFTDPVDRLALNYKGVRYRTEWVEYPDIKAVGISIGAKATIVEPDGSSTWTCPMLVDPNTLDANGAPTVISDSYNIARYLEDTYPSPRLFPIGTMALHQSWARFVSMGIHKPLVDLLIPVCPDILAPRSREYFISTREEDFGPLNKICPVREKGWELVRVGLDRIALALDENGDAQEANLRVIPGCTSYADFQLLAPLLWAVALVSEEEVSALKEWNGGRWGKLIDLHWDLLVVK